MWKKILIGCGIIFVLFVILMGFLAHYVISKGKEFAENIEEIGEAYSDTNKDYYFTLPDPPLMNPQRLKDYLEIRDELRDIIETQPNFFAQLMEADKQNREVSPGEAMKGMISMIKSGKLIADAHLDALNARSMSIKEYTWYSQMITATILQGAEQNLDFDRDLLQPYINWMEDMNKMSTDSGEKIDFQDLKEMLGTEGVPFLEENLELIKENREDIAKMKKIGWIDIFLRSQGYHEQFRPPYPKAIPTPHEGNPFALRPQPTPG